MSHTSSCAQAQSSVCHCSCHGLLHGTVVGSSKPSRTVQPKQRVCIWCGQPPSYDGTVTVHPQGGLYMLQCKICGFKWAPKTPPFPSCPQCGAPPVEIQDDHVFMLGTEVVGRPQPKRHGRRRSRLMRQTLLLP